MMWTTEKIAAALGQLFTHEDVIHSFQFDSRAVKPKDCFIALPGETIDGHNFIDDARARGATCIIGQKNADFLVPDSFKALNQLAMYARDHSPAKRIAITGSVGKTTTTSFLAQILQQKHTIVAPQNSFNNHIGVPLTMTKLSDKTEFGIFEVGTNHPGEIRSLSDLVRPHISIITNIGTAHIGNFGSKKNIALEKAQILYALADDGIGIVPDDEFLEIYKASGKQLIVMQEGKLGFPGFTVSCAQCVETVSAGIQNVTLDPGSAPSGLVRETASLSVAAPTIPKRLQGNLAIVKKAAQLLGVQDFDLSKIELVKGRGAIYPLALNGKHVTIIDDSYNAAFDAFLASLDDLASMKGRKILVVGDMGEVGEFSKSYHDQIAEKMNSLQEISHIIPVGQCISAALALPQVSHDDAVLQIRGAAQDKDIIFFKGSKASGVSKILGIVCHPDEHQDPGVIDVDPDVRQDDKQVGP